jgi:hypothetical protein
MKISFRVNEALVAAMKADAEAHQTPLSTYISNMLCDKYGVERMDLRTGYAKLAEQRKQDALERRQRSVEPAVSGSGPDSGLHHSPGNDYGNAAPSEERGLV